MMENVNQATTAGRRPRWLRRAWWLRQLSAAIAAIGSCTMVVPAELAPSAAIPGICDDCKVERFASCGEGRFLEGPSFDAQGNLWLVGLYSTDILKVTPDGQCSAVAKTGGAPNGARFVAPNRLLITDRDRNLIAFDPVTKLFTNVATKFGRENLRGLNDSVMDKAGGLYFTEPYGSSALRPTGRVFYLPAGDKSEPLLVAEGFAFPNGIALSPDQKRLYVADYATNRIIALPIGEPGRQSAIGISSVFASLHGGIGPDGLATDAQGNVYAAHYMAGEVVVIAPDGRVRGVIAMPPEAGRQTTNVVLHGGWLYITEAGRNEVWRVKTRIGASS